MPPLIIGEIRSPLLNGVLVPHLFRMMHLHEDPLFLDPHNRWRPGQSSVLTHPHYIGHLNYIRHF